MLPLQLAVAQPGSASQPAAGLPASEGKAAGGFAAFLFTLGASPHPSVKPKENLAAKANAEGKAAANAGLVSNPALTVSVPVPIAVLLDGMQAGKLPADSEAPAIEETPKRSAATANRGPAARPTLQGVPELASGKARSFSAPVEATSRPVLAATTQTAVVANAIAPGQFVRPIDPLNRTAKTAELAPPDVDTAKAVPEVRADAGQNPPSDSEQITSPDRSFFPVSLPASPPVTSPLTPLPAPESSPQPNASAMGARRVTSASRTVGQTSGGLEPRQAHIAGRPEPPTPVEQDSEARKSDAAEQPQLAPSGRQIPPPGKSADPGSASQPSQSASPLPKYFVSLSTTPIPPISSAPPQKDSSTALPERTHAEKVQLLPNSPPPGAPTPLPQAGVNPQPATPHLTELKSPALKNSAANIGLKTNAGPILETASSAQPLEHAADAKQISSRQNAPLISHSQAGERQSADPAKNTGEAAPAASSHATAVAGHSDAAASTVNPSTANTSSANVVAHAESPAGAVTGLTQTSGGRDSSPTSSTAPGGKVLPTPPGSAPAPQPTLPGVLQTARLVDRAGQSEMHIGLRSAAFGSVEVHTVVRDSQIGLTVGSEKGDLRTFLGPEIPALQSSLGQHALRFDGVRFLAERSNSQSGFSAFADSQSQSHSGQEGKPVNPARSPGGLPIRAGEAAEIANDAAGLNVHA
jgi:hypothetical protein